MFFLSLKHNSRGHRAKTENLYALGCKLLRESISLSAFFRKNDQRTMIEIVIYLGILNPEIIKI